MGKEKTVVERMISLINRYYRQMEKSMDESSNFNRDLEVINSAFTVLDPDDFSFLSKVDHEQLTALLNLVLREDEKELANGIRAAHYLVQNDIELVDEQMDKLRDLISRSDVKKRSLQRSIATREKAIATLEDCSDLEDELKGLSTSGVFDEKTIAQFFKLFNIKPEEQGRYLDAILKFNTTRILTSIRKMSKEEDKEIEELDVPIEVIDIENKKVTDIIYIPKDEIRIVTIEDGVTKISKNAIVFAIAFFIIVFFISISPFFFISDIIPYFFK